jgi:hypothetical protein
MKERINLTPGYCRDIKARNKQFFVHDLNCPGLWLRIYPSGFKTWYYHYRPRGRQTTSIKLGRFEMLNPFQVYYWHEYNKSSYKIEYHLSEDKKKWLLFRIIYSSIFYLLIILGVINLINRKKQLNFHIMIFSCVLYYAFMLGWVGNTRYFVPSIILLSIFFGNGIYSIINFKK